MINRFGLVKERGLTPINSELYMNGRLYALTTVAAGIKPWDIRSIETSQFTPEGQLFQKHTLKVTQIIETETQPPIFSVESVPSKTLVTDNRFDPPLVYRRTARPPTADELFRMAKDRTLISFYESGKLGSPGRRASNIYVFRIAMIFAATLFPIVAGFIYWRKEKSGPPKSP
jgi:hypothetical protein